VSTLTRTEWKLFLREPVLAFWGLVFPVVLLCVMGLASNGADADLGGLSLVQTYVPILISFTLAVLAVNGLPAALANYRERGVLRRLATTPVGPVRVLRAQVGVSAATAAASLLLVLAVARVGFGVGLPGQVLGFVLAVVLAASALFALGLLVGSLAPTARTANGLGAILFFVMMFFAGLWIPRALMGATLRHVSDFTPLGAASQAIQDSMQGQWPQTLHLAVLAGYAIVFALAAARCFRWE
jgi:ABC-2 type transport system permease protein